MTAEKFDQRLDSEIARMRDPSVTEPPAVKDPLSLEEYVELVSSSMDMPTPDQIRNFLRDVSDTHAYINYGRPGYKVVPVLLPHDHSYPAFDDERLQKFGYLYYYLLTDKNLTVRADDLAYMDAVLPQEVIANGVVIPENITGLAQHKKFVADFGASVTNLLTMVQ